MRRQIIRTFLFLAGAVLFFAVAALAEKSKSIFIYTDSVLPSGQELKAGNYQVQVDATSKQVTFMQGRKVVAKSICQIVDKPAKNDSSQARFGQVNKKQQLQEIRFDGESRTIVLTLGGS